MTTEDETTSEPEDFRRTQCIYCEGWYPLLKHCTCSASIANRRRVEFPATSEGQTETDFSKHLSNASEIVQTWPEWKKNVLGGSPAQPSGNPSIASTRYREAEAGGEMTLEQIDSRLEFLVAMSAAEGMEGHTLHQLRSVMQERNRLLRGDFTSDELQNLCHNLSQDTTRKVAFFSGCTNYQEKLFGCSAISEAESALLAADELAKAVDYSGVYKSSQPVTDALMKFQSVRKQKGL